MRFSLPSGCPNYITAEQEKELERRLEESGMQCPACHSGPKDWTAEVRISSTKEDYDGIDPASARKVPRYRDLLEKNTNLRVEIISFSCGKCGVLFRFPWNKAKELERIILKGVSEYLLEYEYRQEVDYSPL